MPTIDLGTPPPQPEGTLEALPRRLTLTLPELRLLADRAGGAPLPFELPYDEATSPLSSRLGATPAESDRAAYEAALATLHDPADALARRGLLDGDAADPGVVGALGLLATPAAAVDIDVVVGRVQARAWHRSRGSAVATLATADGLVFELAWFPADAWPAELARVAVLPEDHEPTPSSVPDVVDLPYELLDAGVEAVRTGRGDLLATIVGHHGGAARAADGEPLDDATTAGLVSALAGETGGRLRALVADVDAGGAQVGVVSWVLLADGWRHLRPHRSGEDRRVEVRRVEPAELATVLGPVLAEVSG